MQIYCTIFYFRIDIRKNLYFKGLLKIKTSGKPVFCKFFSLILISRNFPYPGPKFPANSRSRKNNRFPVPLRTLVTTHEGAKFFSHESR